MYGCESWTIKKAWAPKNWCFQIVLLERRLENPLNFKDIKPVSPKGNQPWIFNGRTDAETEAPILWPPDEWPNEPTPWKRPWCWERWKATGKGGSSGLRWLETITDSMDVNLSKLWKTVEDRGAWSAAIHGITKGQKWLNNWPAIHTTWRGHT